ncbi:unnamed protein product [Penicillium palitans]
MALPIGNGEGKEVRISNTTTTNEINRQRFGAGAHHLRRREIATCSTMLAPFDAYCEKASFNINIGQIDEWRKAGARPEYFHRVCKDITHLKLKKSEQLLNVMLPTSLSFMLFYKYSTWKILEHWDSTKPLIVELFFCHRLVMELDGPSCWGSNTACQLIYSGYTCSFTTSMIQILTSNS